MIGSLIQLAENPGAVDWNTIKGVVENATTQFSVASTGFAVIRPKEVDSRFLAYSLANHYFVETVSSRSVGVSYPAINASEMVDIKNVLPPNDVQRRYPCGICPVLRGNYHRRNY